jgi:hypothetical protein
VPSFRSLGVARHLYKSAVGFGEQLASSRQMGRLTFCHFAIQSAAPIGMAGAELSTVCRTI